ncbi:MAG: aminopeptidase P family protein [Bacteroidia bacterium]|nr:aminopeptidase P family protein [Bacteroidia bacterium]
MFQKQIYLERRQKLSERVESGIILLMGNVEAPMNYPANTFSFRQDSSFLYFFGLQLPGLAGLIDIDNGKTYLFGNDIDIDDIIWMGPQLSIYELAEKVGVENTASSDKLQEFLKDASEGGRKIHFIPPYRAENKLMLEQLFSIPAASLKEKASVGLIKAIVALRSTKDKYEIAHLDEIQDIGFEMHTAAIKMAKPGVYERTIAGYIEGIAMSHGGGVSFPVILTQHGETLHNHEHGNLLQHNNLLLVDAGFESAMCYATDHTRTIPVGGKFTQKQREIYQIVLNAKNVATAAIKPGIPYKNIHLLAAGQMAIGLTELGLMKGDPKEALAAGAHALFFPHGLGHMMGLDVHDMEDLGENYVGYDEEIQRSEQFGLAYLRFARKLQPGFVVTAEPGIYFIPALIDKWQNEKTNEQFINFDKVNEYRNFGGIRLEDDILVTETGCRLLGKKIIPIDIENIESVMQNC